MIRRILRVGFLIFALVFTCSVFSFAQDGKISFENDIRPILESSCVRCHGAEEPEGGYRIDIRDEALDYVESGDAENSDFYLCLISEDEEELMPPPDDGGPLDDSDIRLIKTWINEGANWPEGLELRALEDSETGDVGESGDGVQAVVVDEAPNIWRAIGSLHPAATHLPMGLLMAAGLFALLSLRGNFVMSDCAYYCLWLGTLGAIAACLTGWWFTLIEFPKETVSTFEDFRNMEHKLFWHRTSSIIATIFALLLSLFAASARNRDPDNGVGWKMGLILLAIGIGYVGHHGGKLTWKASHYDELWEVIDQYIPGLISEDDAVPKPEDAADAASGESSDESDETTSDSDSGGTDTGEVDQENELSLEDSSVPSLD